MAAYLAAWCPKSQCRSIARPLPPASLAHLPTRYRQINREAAEVTRCATAQQLERMLEKVRRVSRSALK